MNQLSRALAVTTALVFLAAPVRSVSPRELWYEWTLGGVPVGHAHVTAGSDGTGAVVTVAESVLEMLRQGESVRVEVYERWTEAPDGTPVAYSSTRKLAQEVTSLEALIEGSRLLLTKTIGSDRAGSQMEIGEGLLFPNAIVELHARKGADGGRAYGFTGFDPDLEQIGRYDVKVVGREELDIGGKPRVLRRLVVRVDLYEGLEATEWRDDDGVLWREEVPALGLVRQRTTREEALRDRQRCDIIASTLVESNVVIDEPSLVDRALYDIWLADGDFGAMVVEDARQKRAGRARRGLLLEVERREPALGEVSPTAPAPPMLEEYLEASPMMQADDPAIREAASRAVADAGQGDWKAARAISAWVYREIADKGFGSAFASAREVLATGAGDCSEHAVLAAAMSRSVGIPSRVVVGLVHFEGVFAYHMWIEVWVEDGWYALDPALGQRSVDATHIKLADSAMRAGSVGEVALGIMKVMNRIGVHVVEYETGDTMHRVDDDRPSP